MSDSLVSAYGPPAAEPRLERSSSTAPVSQSDRIYYLDNVRALAMLLGVFFHGALAYAAIGHSFWIVGGREGSTSISAIAWFSHLFRMGLFFLIAGYFAKLLIEKRGVGKFLINRSLRIALPFIVFWPLTLTAIVAVMFFGVYYVQELPPVLAGFKAAITPPVEGANATPAPPPPLSTSYLWFLYYLMMFSIIAAISSLIKIGSFKAIVDRVYSMPALLLIAPLALVPGICGVGPLMQAPESFIPQLWAFAYFGLYFWAGWFLRGREQALDRVTPYSWLLVGASVALYVPYYLAVSNDLENKTWTVLPAIVLNAYISVFMTVACLGLGKTYLSGHSKVLRFISDSSYWTYLIHLPLIMFIQTFMVDWHANGWIKLFISVTVTFAISMITYVVFVRYTPIGWMLNGRKRSEKAIIKSADQPAVAFGSPNASVSVTSNA